MKKNITVKIFLRIYPHVRTARTARGWVDTWGVEEEVVLGRSWCRGGDAFHTPVQLLQAAVQPGPAALHRPAAAVRL